MWITCVSVSQFAGIVHVLIIGFTFLSPPTKKKGPAFNQEKIKNYGIQIWVNIAAF